MADADAGTLATPDRSLLVARLWRNWSECRLHPAQSQPKPDRCQQPLRANHAILGAAGTHRVVTLDTTSGTRVSGGVHADGGVSASRLAARGTATRSDPVDVAPGSGSPDRHLRERDRCRWYGRLWSAVRQAMQPGRYPRAPAPPDHG